MNRPPRNEEVQADLLVRTHLEVDRFRQARTCRRRCPAFVVVELARQCDGKSLDDLVFPGPGGNYLRRSVSSTGWFTRAVARAEVPRLTPHDLRHTAASLAVSAGANVKALQRMLGHASAAMTLDVYADFFDDDLEAVGTALDRAASAAGVGNVWARADLRVVGQNAEKPLTRS